MYPKLMFMLGFILEILCLFIVTLGYEQRKLLLVVLMQQKRQGSNEVGTYFPTGHSCKLQPGFHNQITTLTGT